MKLRESGMPAQDYWETLFDVSGILDAFGFGPETGHVVELGCGYGTFTIPLARRIKGRVFAVDIDPAMVTATGDRATKAGLLNVRAELRDVVADGFGVPHASCEAALLFNILHGERPVELLREAARAVRPGGVLAVIHWRTDMPTPRGPSAEIRPDPTQITEWATTAGNLKLKKGPFDLRPYHYGLMFSRDEARGAA